MLLMDVDGVMTDGRLYNIPDAAGNMVETKGFDSQDGISLQWMCWNNIRTGLISGRARPRRSNAPSNANLPTFIKDTSKKSRFSKRSLQMPRSTRSGWRISETT